MNPLGQIPILEFAGEGSSSSGEPSMAIPKPMEGLQGISTPPFLTKTYDLVNDPNTNHIVSWSIGNNSFIVWDPETFATQILPTYFKHSNLSSFIRQLNTYGFKKVDPDKLEFAHERFLRGQRQLLKEIKRRKPPVYPQSSHQDFDPCVELGQFGPESEIDRLRRDKQVLMVELVKLRQEQQNTKAHLREIEHRLKATEMKQKQITGFMAKLIQNPRFVEQLVQQEKMKEFVDAFSNKRRRTIDQGGEGETSGRQETQGYGDSKRLKVLDQGETSKGKEVKQEGGHKSLDKGFWEDLLNDQIDDDMGLLGNEVEGEEVDKLVENLVFPK